MGRRCSRAIVSGSSFLSRSFLKLMACIVTFRLLDSVILRSLNGPNCDKHAYSYLYDARHTLYTKFIPHQLLRREMTNMCHNKPRALLTADGVEPSIVGCIR